MKAITRRGIEVATAEEHGRTRQELSCRFARLMARTPLRRYRDGRTGVDDGDLHESMVRDSTGQSA